MNRLLRGLPLLRCVICGTVALVNVFHPVLHAFEGGVLDAALAQLNQLAYGLGLITVDNAAVSEDEIEWGYRG